MRALEERGIGRPSTYASIMGTILDRGYVRKVGQALVPSFLAFAVTNLLEQHFAQLVDYEFTALMEDDLDRIAAGDEERTAWLRRFYFGERRAATSGLKALVSDLGDIDARAINTIEIGERDRAARRPLRPVHRAGRRASDDLRRDRSRRADGRARPRSCSPRARSSASSASNPETGRTIVVKNGRYGPYVTEVAEERREAAHGVALQVDVARDGDARGRAPRSCRCRASSASTPPTVRRSSSRTAATARS